ncbi:MAG: sigma-70 family RNA polymerase sigma factor [Saprospiraceae bacterium]|nr:sigma-70 family RNA polymerase sigma factor [Saprospiraceae bacterium]MBK7467297.1 sigma-70 family RNA polymerase sigma factor [Saprospiraceae bacterium]MBK9995195.1 sigma-70 family RNA polymerase sigma factor [Saprospiraceae bacterium]
MSKKVQIEDLDGNTIISLISQGNMEVLDQVYTTYKPAYLNWARQRFPSTNQQDIVDSWHDSIIAFYEQVISKKLISLTCEIKTYLFTIGYRSLLKKHKKIQKIFDDEEIDKKLIDASLNLFFEEEDPLKEQKEMLLKEINQLPTQSQQILMLRFIEGKSLKDISEIVNYNSLNVLSATISRSLKLLKNKIQNNKK